ncbi:Uncharacterised protein [Lederbergia lenta]|uniref:Uncharacterized protein n=1 Tax=Lederbergia lenta TaxID=1467 RepID=A0A2X4WAR0_LEDLE|nr:Uncharacterised protein [Lederbergia lenta]
MLRSLAMLGNERRAVSGTGTALFIADNDCG